MKNIIKLVFPILSILLFSNSPLAAINYGASYWTATDGDVNQIRLGYGNFYLGHGNNLLPLRKYDRVKVEAGGTGGRGYKLSNRAGQSIRLSKNRFKFYKEKRNGSFLSEIWSKELGPDTNIFKLIFSPKHKIIASDIKPVPLPASVWLFGIGIIGIVTLSRRKYAT